jgi:ribonuclease Z
MSDEFLQKSEFGKTIASNHTTPEDAGEVFRRANPKLAVYTHILFFGDYPVEDLISSTRKHYSGPLEVGEDLMSIEVGEKVEVRRFMP